MSTIALHNDELGLRIHFSDFVDANHDIFAREVTITNLLDNERDVRVFFHQGFQISAMGRADTVMYVPEGPVHAGLQKDGATLLVYAEAEDGTSF